MSRWRRLRILFFLAAAALAAQPKTDFNLYYRYPLSLGLGLRSVSVLADYEQGTPYEGLEIAGTIRLPLKARPSWQPALEIGTLRFNSQASSDPDAWDHQSYFAMLGLGYVQRLSRQFEVGAQLAAGYSHTLFPNLAGGAAAVPEILASVEGGIALNPSFSLAIQIQPRLTYRKSLLGYFTGFDGLLFGLGLGLQYRSGKDPDSAEALLRSLKLLEAKAGPLFAAMQSYYTSHPVGEILLQNTERQSLEDLEISFFQPGYMDGPTTCQQVEELEPGATLRVPLLAVFNAQIFGSEGTTPLTAELAVKYNRGPRAAEQKFSISYDLHDKRSIVWDDDRKVGAFITPSDSALQNYLAFVRQSCKSETVSGYPEAVQTAVQAFAALGVLGCLYQSDPAIPYASARSGALDSVSLPRDTLVKGAGDCDDLTVLYCSLLESAGIRTGFITVPGHIFAAFDSGLPARRWSVLHPDRGLGLNLDGELWIPVEVTLLGRVGFTEAWQRGMQAWNEAKEDSRRLYRTADAQKLFRPVSLRETDLGLQYGSQAEISRAFQSELARVAGTLIESATAAARQEGTAQQLTRLGLQYVRFDRYEEAAAAFRGALARDRWASSRAHQPGGGVLLQAGFLRRPGRIRKGRQGRGIRGGATTELAAKVYLCLSKAHLGNGNPAAAREYFSKAQDLDPQQASEHLYLAGATGGSSTGRAAEADLRALFAEEP